MKYLLLFFTTFSISTIAKAGVVEDFEKAFSEPFYLAGEESEALTPQMQARKEALEIRLNNPQAWEMVKSEKIDEFSYFGFKLQDVENGKLSMKSFLEELQKYLNK